MMDDDNLANEGSPEDLIEDDEDNGAPASPQKNLNKAEYVALAPFKDLYKSSPIIQMAFEFGQQIIPLSAVGMIMNYSGNHLLHYIYSTMHKKVFHPMTRVTSVTLMTNGDIIT